MEIYPYGHEDHRPDRDLILFDMPKSQRFLALTALTIKPEKIGALKSQLG